MNGTAHPHARDALARLTGRVDRAGGYTKASLLLAAETRVVARLVIEDAILAALTAGGPLDADALAALPDVVDALAVPGATLADALDHLTALGDIAPGPDCTWSAS